VGILFIGVRYIWCLPREIRKSLEKEHDSTQKLILLWLLICFSASLVASYIMVFAAAIVPAIDQNIIKDSLPLLLIPQFTLLGVALGFHFGQKK
jgi:hypothetical protein